MKNNPYQAILNSQTKSYQMSSHYNLLFMKYKHIVKHEAWITRENIWHYATWKVI